MFKKVVDVVFPFPFVDPLLCNQRFGEFARLTWPLCGNLDIVKISKQIVAAGVPRTATYTPEARRRRGLEVSA